MKSLVTVLLPLFLTISANAIPRMGNDGGGGHFCKSQATLFAQNISDVLEENRELAKKYPEWQKLATVMDPTKNPGFTVKITKLPIQNCRNTENALACSRVSENTLEIFCGDGGWNSLTTQEKYKQIAHELYWWSDLDDSNYFYSQKFMKDIYPSIEEIASYSQKILTLGQGEISSTEAFLSKTGKCRPVNLNGAAWVKQKDGRLVCESNNGVPGPWYGYCAIEVEYNYSIIINGTYWLDRKIDFTNNSLSSLVGTEFSETQCNAYAKRGFKESSLYWMSKLEDVNRGTVETAQLDKYRCFKNELRMTYDPTTNQVGGTDFNEIRVPCSY